MKGCIAKDEWYPVYTLEVPDVDGYCYGKQIEVSDELLLRWKAAEQIFGEVQNELRHLYLEESK